MFTGEKGTIQAAGAANQTSVNCHGMNAKDIGNGALYPLAVLSLDMSCWVQFCKVSETHTGVTHDIQWPPGQQMLFLEISSAGWTFQDELFSGEESRRELVCSRFQPSCWFPSLIRLLVKASSPMTDLLV